MADQRWIPAWVGLGSNLDGPEARVLHAVDALDEIAGCRVVAVSPLFRTAPIGEPDQPDYVNAVAGISTCLAPVTLLTQLQNIEAAHGRDRGGPKWGPRTLDLDLLLYGDLEVETEGLTVPHPALKERNFVVYPLAMIAPDLVLPDGTPVAELARRLGTEGMEEIGSPRPGDVESPE